MSKLSNIERINKEHTKDEFLRDVLIQLALKETTPTDIFNSQFQSVEEKEAEYLMVSAEVNVSYSCTVGYDKKVEYYEDGRKKTRTVTNWKPFSGTNASEETVFEGNGANAEEYAWDNEVRSFIYSCKKESFMEYTGKEINVNTNALERAKKSCISSCFYRVSLPGDHQKDKDYSGVANVTEISCVVIPEYSTEYRYQDQNYKAKAFACGTLISNVDAPSIASDVDKEGKEKTKIFKFSAIGALIAGITLNVLSGVVDGIGYWHWLAYIVALGLGVTYFVARYKIEKNIYALKREEKKQALIATLKAKGLKALSEKELALFNK